MALTERQKCEVIKIIQAKALNRYESAPQLWFEPDSDVLHCIGNVLIFIKSCVVPYIEDMSNINIIIRSNITIEFPDLVTVNRLSISSHDRVLLKAPKLSNIIDPENTLVLSPNANIELPSLKKVAYIVTFNKIVDDLTFKIIDCLRLYKSQYITNTLEYVRDVYLDNSAIIFTNVPKSVKVDIESVGTIITPESSAHLFKNIPDTVELILFTEGE